MKFKFFRSSVFSEEGEAGSVTTTSPPTTTSTTSGDIAQYPWILGYSRRTNKSKKKKRKNISESYFEKPFKSPSEYAYSVISSVFRPIEKELKKYGIKTSLIDQTLKIETPLGTKYSLYFNGYDLIFAPLHLNPKMDKDDEDIVAEEEEFLVWEIPSDEDVGLYWGNQEISQKIVYETTSVVLGIDIMLETPPLVDLSISKPLTQEELKQVKEHFEVIKKEDYLGSFNQLDIYRKKYGDKKEPQNENTTLSPPKHRPYNDWGKTFFFRNADAFREKLLDYSWKNKKGKRVGNMVYWGESLRYHFTSTSTDYVEALVPNKKGEKTWCCIHVIRKLPANSDDFYFEELVDYLNGFSIPEKFQETKWNMAKFLRKVWDVHADEITYIGGVAYHKDGEWGINFQVSATGQGLPSTSDNMAAIVQYYFKKENETGMVFACVDPTPSTTPTDRQSTVADFIWRIYPSFDIEKFVNMLKRYTDST